MYKLWLFVMGILVFASIPVPGKVYEDIPGVTKLSETKKTSVNFQFQDINGHAVSLKDFRGKYVFIDVWATWCGPCCSEIPHLQQLEKSFEKKKIVFVSISVDRDVNVWKRVVKERGMKGIQLHYGSNGRFMEFFEIENIPRFILLDKKGRLVNGRMTKPSEKVTGETLKKLKGI